MNGKEIIEQLDKLFAENRVKDAENYLYDTLKITRDECDWATELTVLNELIGFHRRSGNGEKAREAIDSALQLLEKHKLTDSVTGANTLLNSATTLKAFNKSRESTMLYERAFEVYSRRISPSDYRFAGFYNNYALALADIGNTKDALKCYENALSILIRLGGNEPEIAVTYCNMAFLYDDLGEDEFAATSLDNALKTLNTPNIECNGYYAFNCEKCADAFKYFGRFIDQWELEKRAKEIYERNRTGDTVL